MRGYSYHLGYEIRTGIKDTSLMLMNYLFPLGFLLLTGLFMTQINPLFRQIMIPGMIMFAIMSSTLLNLSNTQIQQREAGIYRSYRVNGIKPLSLVTIPVIGSLIHCILVSLIITIVSLLFFDATGPVNWGMFIIVITASGLCMASFAMLIGTVAPSQRAGILLSQALYIPSVILGGLMVPSSMIPENVQLFSHLLPATTSIEAFEALAMSSSQGPVTPLLVLALSTLVNLGLVAVLFRYEPSETKVRNLPLALIGLLPFLLAYLAG